MKIYLLNVSRNCGEEQYTEFAYFDKAKAEEACKSWNKAEYEKDLKDAEDKNMSYDDWVGWGNDYAYVVQVEIIS